MRSLCPSKPEQLTGHLGVHRFVALTRWAIPALLATCAAVASTQALASTPVAAPPKSIAILAAAGDQFQYVRRKPGTASRIEPFIRRWATMPGNGLNLWVLRGMDRALSSQFPDAALTMLTLTPTAEDRAVLPQQREAHTTRRVMDYLLGLPERAQWDQIFVVTPKWLMDEHKGMGSRLSGIGLFVQPVPRNLDEEDELEAEAADDAVRDLTTQEFKKQRSATYVAPFFYMQVTVLDGKTLAVIRREERYDFRKIINSESTALDVEATLTPKQLAGEIERFVESAARRMIVDRPGTIDVGPVRTLPAPTR
ncbi:MAG: hypothetical protein JNL19_14275 [Burkholderiales bacterium]|nr:hypothetical protein [Burkholderiales bacterium]